MKSNDTQGKRLKKLSRELNRLKDLFAVTQSERRALTVILIILAALILARMGMSRWYKEPSILISEPEYMALQKVRRAQTAKSYNRKRTHRRHEKTTIRPFPFDPNHVDSLILDSLGIPWYVAKNWLAYLEAGATIRSASEIARIYGMQEQWVTVIGPFADFPRKGEATVTQREVIELNLADSAQLISLPGIGPVFARRILAYRTLLGGFVNPWQLMEVYGMDSLRLNGCLPFISADSTLLERLDLNATPFDELRRHPLVGYELAYAISEHRKVYGELYALPELDIFHKLPVENRKLLQHYFR